MRSGPGENLPPLENLGWTDEEAALTVLQNGAFQALGDHQWKVRWDNPTDWEGKVTLPQQDLKGRVEVEEGTSIAIVPLKNLASQERPHPYAVSYVNKDGEVEHFPPEAHLIMANDHLGDDDVLILEARSRPGKPGHLLYWERVENKQVQELRQELRQVAKTVPADQLRAFYKKIDWEEVKKQLAIALPKLQLALNTLVSRPENQDVEFRFPENDRSRGFPSVFGNTKGEESTRAQLEAKLNKLAAVLQEAANQLGLTISSSAPVTHVSEKMQFKISPIELPLKPE